MNLLVIGNGLDIDLTLPTRYTDFLDFVNAFMSSVGSDIEKINEIPGIERIRLSSLMNLIKMLTFIAPFLRDTKIFTLTT